MRNCPYCNKCSNQVGRLGVVEAGRRSRWSDDEKLRIALEGLQTAERYCEQRAAAAIGIVLQFSPRGHTVTPNYLLKIQFEINLQSAFVGKSSEPCRAVNRGKTGDSADA